MPLIPYAGHRPDIHPESFVARGVVLTGQVKVGRLSSVWYGTVARGDINRIEIGEASNIQDGSILHVDDTFPCLVGNRVVVGHQVVLHGTHVEDDCLIGIGSKLLNGSVIQRGAMVAAGSLVPEGMVVPSGTLVMGSPARVKRPLTPEESALILHLSEKYVKVWKTYVSSMKGPDDEHP
ncbi:MAG: gamma carbonic anhydrase family protein [Planctomycetota bacterium]